MYQMVDQLRRNQGNPLELLKQVTSNYTPEQMQNFYATAQQMGFPNEFLNEIQNNIK